MGMRIGFGAPVAGAWATPGYLTAFARRAEETGYASLWGFQRLLVPEGSGMEPVYRSVLDPMVALGYAAASTSRIRLGVAVINLPFVSPVVLAKQAATLDVLSGGRLDLGLGVGWMPEEFAATGASMQRRGARAEEYIAVLHALWADGVTEFSGEFYTVPAARMAPKPVQRPGPPVILGGVAQRDFDPRRRVKRVQGRPGVWEMTWAADGRATFEYGPEVIAGEPHVIWRRFSTHDVFRRP